MADGEVDDEPQSYANAKHNQLNLHILNPHFSLHLGTLCSKILCLKYNTDMQTIRATSKSWIEFKKANGQTNSTISYYNSLFHCAARFLILTMLDFLIKLAYTKQKYLNPPL